MGRNAFHVAFRRATGLAPVAYLIRHRLQRAIILLRTTSKSVTDIGLQVGFSDANYFARKFHEIVGVSPRAFRVSSAARSTKLVRRLALPTARCMGDMEGWRDGTPNPKPLNIQ
ncbi:MAG: helix-turn-helix transcriptional regulator [bacterium]|nr:helix-turn-helix transcriptional regulator [bacterium]